MAGSSDRTAARANLRLGFCRSGLLWTLLLANARGFAAQTTEVVQLGAAHAPGAQNFDFVDHARVDRENAFHALAEGDLAHGEGVARAAVIAGDADAFEGLDALLVPLLDLHVHAYRVAGVEGRQRRTRLLFDKLLDGWLQAHGNGSPSGGRATGQNGRNIVYQSLRAYRASRSRRWRAVFRSA